MKTTKQLEIMETLNRIAELETKVNEAKTYNEDGRQVVVNACKELYNLIEEDYHDAGADCLLEDMYNDLTSGNFAEPFMCEQKKSKFELYKTIYINNVLPKLTK